MTGNYKSQQNDLVKEALLMVCIFGLSIFEFSIGLSLQTLHYSLETK